MTHDPTSEGRDHRSAPPLDRRETPRVPLQFAGPRTRPTPIHRDPAADLPWVVVLAGGEGLRMRSLTIRSDGVPVPKQFYSFRDERSLLRQTLDRARALTTPDRILVLVLESHRAWWGGALADLPAENVLAQPEPRGTGVAVLHALAHVRMHADDPRLVVMPSDHEVDDEPRLLRAMRRAVSVTARFPGHVVLLGVAPWYADFEYGFIVPEPHEVEQALPVQAFIECPSPAVASDLLRAGALWNSFIFATTGAALDRLYETSYPSLAREYTRELLLSGGASGRVARLFHELPTLDFCLDLLRWRTEQLRTIAVPECGWTDLGTPRRLAAWLEQHRTASFWRDPSVARLPGIVR